MEKRIHDMDGFTKLLGEDIGSGWRKLEWEPHEMKKDFVWVPNCCCSFAARLHADGKGVTLGYRGAIDAISKYAIAVRYIGKDDWESTFVRNDQDWDDERPQSNSDDISWCMRAAIEALVDIGPSANQEEAYAQI